MINRLSFLFDKPKRSYNEIGTLNLMILNNSIKQRYLYRLKIKLEGFKKDMNSKSITNDCFFWNVSNEVLARIEGASYVSNKEKQNDYLWFHPYADNLIT